MQIKSITVNAAGLAAGTDMQGNSPMVNQDSHGKLVSHGTNLMRAGGRNTFGPECRVSISQEGKDLSRQQSAEKSAQGTASVKEERKLLRQQEEAERSKEIREGYREQLNEIDKQITAYNNSFLPTSTLTRMEKNKKIYDTTLMQKTVEEQQKLMEAMQSQKQFQTEEGQRLAKEAQQMAMQSAQYKEEIDENNRDLLTLLKTMEEAEKAEDERENGEVKGDGNGSGTGASGTGNSVSDVIQGTAAQFMMSSVNRESGVQELLGEIDKSAHWFLDTADSITQNVLQKSAEIRATIDDESFTDEQIEDMMKLFVDGTTKPGLAEEYRKRGWGIGMDLNYNNVKYFRAFGLQVLRDMREAGIQHLADDPLKGMQDTKNSMMLSAADAALGEARQGGLDKASQEIADEVKKLIDERNDVDRVSQEKEEDEKEQAKKEEEEEQNQMQEEPLQPEKQDRGSI